MHFKLYKDDEVCVYMKFQCLAFFLLRLLSVLMDIGMDIGIGLPTCILGMLVKGQDAGNGLGVAHSL